MHVHVTSDLKCIQLVKKTKNKKIKLHFFSWFIFLYSFKVDKQTIAKFSLSMKFIFPRKLSQVIEEVELL